MGQGIGALLQGLGDIGNAYLSASFSRKERERAQNFLRKFTVQKPGLMVEGLKRAGLNPILAAEGGFSGTVSGPGFQAPAGRTSDYTSSALQGAQLALTRQTARKTAAEADRAQTLAQEELDTKDMHAWDRHLKAATIRAQIAAGVPNPADYGGLSVTASTAKNAADAKATEDRYQAQLDAVRAALERAGQGAAEVTGSKLGGYMQLINRGINSAAAGASALR